MDRSPQLEAALGVLRRLAEAGYEACLAGGCVRDLLLGREPHDYDVATSAPPAVVLEAFDQTFAVGAHFGVVLVATKHPKTGERIVTEVATFRCDGSYSDGRRPDEVRYTTSAEEDVRRRDFTLNGLLLDAGRLLPQGPKPLAPGQSKMHGLKSAPFDSSKAEPAFDSSQAEEALGWRPERIRSAVIDHVGGVADLDAGLIRAIGRPEARFEEDRLRMLRAVRFAARFGFALEPSTLAAIRSHAPRVASVSRERVRDELTRMLTEGHARRAFELLDETGLLEQALPEVARMKGVEQPPRFHPEGDVWAHTLILLEQLGPGASATLAWGTLLHDVGKPATFRRAEDRIRFDGHVEVGVAIAAEICRRFRFSNDETRRILALIGNHMRFMDVERMKASTLKRFLRTEGFDEHLALHRMDCLAASGNLESWEYARAQLAVLTPEAVRPALLVTGRELIAAGYRPGAAFKAMLRAAEDAQLEGRVNTAEEALALVTREFGPPPLLEPVHKPYSPQPGVDESEQGMDSADAGRSS